VLSTPSTCHAAGRRRGESVRCSIGAASVGRQLGQPGQGRGRSRQWWPVGVGAGGVGSAAAGERRAGHGAWCPQALSGPVGQGGDEV